MLTQTGSTAQRIAKYRPHQIIFAVSVSESAISHLQMIRGVISIYVRSFRVTDEVITSALSQAKEMGLVESGNMVVCVHGVQEEVSGGTNLLKVVVCP